MTAIDMTIAAAAQPRRFTKIAAIAALALALAGPAALAANALRDGSGYFNSPAKTVTGSGYAIAMKTVDVSKAPPPRSSGGSAPRSSARPHWPVRIAAALFRNARA